MNTPLPQRWDIFCRVIDNYGDIGVCWRLARQLAAEHGLAVRLWVDQLAALRALHPRVDHTAARQRVCGVDVFAYHPLDADAAYPRPAQVVIDAFGGGLPPRYVAAMAAMASAAPAASPAQSGERPLWIVLEYLSAEPWVREHHGLPSPHPQYGLPRYFFFPGVAEGTGGILREADLLARRDAFYTQARQRWWARHGFAAVQPEAVAVSLFAYPHAPVAALLEAWARGAVPLVAAVPSGPLAARVRDAWDGCDADRVHRGNLEVRFMPFVPQAEYDRLLWACDVNFVRGEDSFARAQWAGRPFVWHIYPQEGNAHRVKLEAFLARYAASLPLPAAQAVRGLWQAWNAVPGAPALDAAWAAFLDRRAQQTQGLRRWQKQLEAVGDLTGNLLKFCRKML